jgi:hypothetical protein
VTLTLILVERELCMGGCEEKSWVREAEESPLLEAVDWETSSENTES